MMRSMGTMNMLRTLAISVAALAAGCSDSHPKNQVGGETHFLSACVDGACSDGLECVCGVCTAPCGSRIDCTQYDEDATCVSLEVSSALCDAVPSSGRVCDVRCDESDECSGLGDGFECTAERCRPEEIAEQITDAGQDGGNDAGNDAEVECTEETCGKVSDPLVLFVVDTSGSMERKTQCTCESASCTECLPQCSASGSDKNRWAQVIEAFTGTFEEFSCEAISRETVGAYDYAYPIPYHMPRGEQRDDGVLHDFAGRVRFGLATFDGVSSYDRVEQRSQEEFSVERSSGEEGLWSYPPADEWTATSSGAATYQTYRYPGCPHPYVMNTGIRSRDADAGALFVDLGNTLRTEAVETIQRSLVATRPYGGTPIAASLDDVRALFEHDPWMAPERAVPDHPRHVILITDGRADDDYRNVNCDCSEPGSGKNCDNYISPTEESVEMRCPYPRPEIAARRLLCGADESCAVRLVDNVHVIGLDIANDAVASRQIRDIAREGGSDALFASTGEELRNALSVILQSILDEQVDLSSGIACAAGELTYEHGARWRDGCGFCECQNGVTRCDAEACTQCLRDWDCAEGQHCRFDGIGCETGYCVPSTSLLCDAPSSHDTVCGCNGETYDSPCDAPSGIAHTGACEQTSCPWVTTAIEHGEVMPNAYLCEQCTCIDGDFLCAEQPGSCAGCSSTSSCDDGQACVLPVGACTPSDESEGYCINVPQRCVASAVDEPLFCACDGNFYTECELLLNGQNKADSSACATD